MYFWLQVQSLLVLDETLQVKKFDDADFKYDTSFLKFQLKIPNYGNFGPKLKLQLQPKNT